MRGLRLATCAALALLALVCSPGGASAQNGRQAIVPAALADGERAV